ncbi:hypothetical protein GALMADRAFT_769368 [Galerina marginata CBS 339.88]|uniref:Uncharacterized protein n=1 Tax=Galerina marginata (strain CBS 339.88) TaxID=685588 RepID=A0A067SN42_GALM3|nr:hypothetical protein GALMADRAFT_769368 [Galerina marginata CBS 339.88]
MKHSAAKAQLVGYPWTLYDFDKVFDYNPCEYVNDAINHHRKTIPLASSIAVYPIALVFGVGGENTGSRRIGIQPLNDTTLLVVLGVQADMAISLGMGYDDGSLLRVEVVLAHDLTSNGRAGDGGSVSTSCDSDVRPYVVFVWAIQKKCAYQRPVAQR